MRKKLLVILLVVCMLLTACGKQGEAPATGGDGKEAPAKEAEAKEKVIENTVKGFKGDIKVKTSFDKDGKIAKVEVLENQETEDIGGVDLKE